VYCPLKFNSATLDLTGATSTVSCQCEQEQCAWWKRYTVEGQPALNGRCCIPELERVLSRIARNVPT